MRLVALALVLAMTPSVLSAQEQTVEGAQRFLELTLYRTKIKFVYADGDFQLGTVDGEISSPSRCMTKFASIDLAADSTLAANNIRDKYLSWERIAGIERSFWDVTVKRVGSNEHYRFTLQTEDMAKRVVTAMEFLRKNCDEAAATGF